MQSLMQSLQSPGFVFMPGSTSGTGVVGSLDAGAAATSLAHTGAGGGNGAARAYVAGAVVLALAARAARRLTGATNCRREANRVLRRNDQSPFRDGVNNPNALKEGNCDIPGVMTRAVNQKTAWYNSPEDGPSMFDPLDPNKMLLPEQQEEIRAKEKEEQDIRDAAMAKVSGKGQRHAVWLSSRAEFEKNVEEWLTREGLTEEMKESLETVLKQQKAGKIPKNWATWAVCNVDLLENGGGFYLIAPRMPQAIIIVEPADKTTNNIQHIAVDPGELGSGLAEAVLDWMDSLKPKSSVIRRPDEWNAFNLQVQELADDEFVQSSKGM